MTDDQELIRPWLQLKAAMQNQYFRMDGVTVELSHSDWDRLRSQLASGQMFPGGFVNIAGIKIQGPNPDKRESEEMREVLLRTAASLNAAISLLKRSPKIAAPSNLMFDMMVEDYERSLESAQYLLRGRPTLDVMRSPAPRNDA